MDEEIENFGGIVMPDLVAFFFEKFFNQILQKSLQEFPKEPLEEFLKKF